MTTVRIERGIPTVWKRRRSEIPKTTYGMTSGLRRSADTGAFARKLRRTSAIAARTPSSTAPRLESDAMTALVQSAPLRSELPRNWPYQWIVKPLRGKDGMV
jgi:hypothetical protein